MVSRLAFTCILSITVVAGMHWYRSRDNQETDPAFVQIDVNLMSDAPEAMRQQWSDLVERGRRRDAFSRFDARLQAALLRRETSLRDATEKMYYYCLQHYPEHLDNIFHAERGSHIKMKIAQNILRSLTVRQEVMGCDQSIVAYFECELSTLPYERQIIRSATVRERCGCRAP
jgi:hypothetical protein